MATRNTKLDDGIVQMPTDTTANRPGLAGGTLAGVTAVAGMLRYNTTTNYMEYYDGIQWNSITSPPSFASISPSSFSTSGQTITVSGTNFQSGAVAAIISKTGTVYNADTTTVVNSTTVTFPTTTAMAADVNDPFDVRITNASGLSAAGVGVLSLTVNPSFTTAPGSIGTIYDSNRASYSLSVVTATNTESDVALTYAVTSGALPTGLSLASNGTISGTASAVGTDTTSTFSVTATGTDSSNSGNTVTATRSFSITVKAPVITSFFSTGPATFSVPTGITSVKVLAVAGGAGGGNAFPGDAAGGGGGAGGVVVHNTYPVSPGGSVSLSVGAGGAGGTIDTPGAPNPVAMGQPGTPTTFGAITANGGGGGGHFPDIDADQGQGIPGGSGGGAGGAGLTTKSGGTATQGPSGGGTGYGYPGGSHTGTGQSNGSTSCGGGGGAGGAGANGVANARGGAGGAGYSWPVNSTTYAGGGGGGGSRGGDPVGGLGGSGGGGPAGQTPNAAAPGPSGATAGNPGTTNTGGGGGGGSAGPSCFTVAGGAGAPGIVIVAY
jgi:mucin-19